MKPINLSEFSEQALIEEAKKQKKGVIALRVIICLLMCVAIYSATHKGSFIIACLPLFFMSFFITSENNYKAVKSEIELRKNQVR
jgi:hypothetical protein